jgi:hypothetical protein
VRCSAGFLSLLAPISLVFHGWRRWSQEAAVRRVTPVVVIVAVLVSLHSIGQA